MFKRLLFPVFCLFVFGAAMGQKPASPCGTLPHKSDWLKKYQAAPHDYSKMEDTIIYVPLTIHLLGSDEGTGYFGYNNLFDAFCTLNEDFEPLNIQFFLEGEINYINSTAWDAHPTVLDGAEMMFANNVENTMNCYFLSDPAGNCGYNLPYAGMTVAKSCAGVNDHTWAHEMGHALSLAHPFLGWEGGVSHDNSVEHSFSTPAPLTVLYDYTYFLDTLILDTMIIDTAFVEFVDGSNCHIAADGFCDTAPDYLASRWNCNAEMESSVTQTDPDGVTFKSDGTLIMSYADDACSYRFSDEQTAAMRANLIDEKPNLLYNQESEESVTGIANLVAPVENEIVHFENVELEWDAVPNATFYLVEVTRLPTFPNSITKSYIVDENLLTLDDLEVDKKYYWRVKAFNRLHFCTQLSGHESFETENLVAVNEIEELSSLSVYPTIIKAGASIQIEANANEQFAGNVQLFNNLGVLVSEELIHFSSGKNSMSFEVGEQLPSGLYFLSLNVKGRLVTERIIIE